jgi:hypothetical protein
MEFTKPITEVITQRTSIRTYAKSPIEPGKEAVLKEFIASHQAGPFRTNMRFQLITAHQDDIDALKGLGTYGVIQNPSGFIVGAIEPGSKNLEDFGYVMEHIILLATDLGLGTCWLGGSFRQSNFAKAIAASEHESLPAVISIGNIAVKPSLRDTFFRFVVKPHKRLPWEQLFCSENFTKPLSQAMAVAYAAPLEMVRLAPSASNKQLWRIVKAPNHNNFHFYLQRTKGYNRSQSKFFKMADLQRADLGIAMCHFELSAKELGLQGQWALADPGLPALPELTEYTVSWIG